MNRKFTWLFISCLMVVTLLVTSCGATPDDGDINGNNGDGDGVVNGGDGDGGDGGVVDDDAEMVLNAVGKLVEKPQYGGWYHISRTTDFRSFDDCLSTSPQYAVPNINLTNEELSVGDWTKSTQGTGEASWTCGGTYFPHLMTGCLATSWDLPDNETIIWHIRQGVYWHDKPPVNGREFNAHDVVYNLNRAFNATGSYMAGNYPQDKGRGPTSIIALDDWTVEMKVPPEQQVPILFGTNGYIVMQPPEMIEEYGDMSDWQNACGTGPFILTDYTPVSSATYEKNPNYWRKHPLHPEDQMPYVDGVQFLIIPDSTTAQAAFRTGKLEARFGVNKDDLEALMRTNPDLLWDTVTPQLNPCIFMRQDKPELPYDDIRVRKALFYGIDHQAIIDDYYEGNAEMITAPIAHIPELEAMYRSLEEYPEDIQKLYGYYPEEAMDLLADAGYPDGFECTVLSTTEGLLPIIKDMWSKINVEMNIEIKTSAVFNSIIVGSRQEDMVYYYLDGRPVLKCNYWRPEIYFNLSRIQNDYFDEVWPVLNESMLDWDKCAEIIKDLEPRMRAEAYQIDLPAGYSYFLWWPWLKGWHGETTIGYWNDYTQFQYLWIDTELREELSGLSR